MPNSEPVAASLLVDVPVEINGNEIKITLGDRRYRVLGLEKNTTVGMLQINLMVMRGEKLHVDNFNLYLARHRAIYSKQAAEELGIKEEVISRDLRRLLGKLEELQHQIIQKSLAPKEEEVKLSPEERAEALALLRDPRLLERVLEDFERCGVVGEETNKRIAYLAAVSRLLEKPLAIVVQSSSSAGKSSLMDAVLDFMPGEQRESYTAMTGQALFYMGQKNLKHKILAVSEEEGASRAAYPLKLLQSEAVIRIASTGKDPVSGKQMTHEYVVEGPVMLFLTTTAVDLDEELLNRCLVLTVDEGREQTRAIHRKQREARTTEGLWAQRKRAKIVQLHRNAQRLLRPLAVAINHADEEEFPDHLTRTRRDYTKLLTLIEAVALLHQHQREIKKDTRDGETLEYIEATTEDVKLARQLMRQVLMPSLDELPPHTRRLLGQIERMSQEESERLEIEPSDYCFTRRTLREYTRWGDTQLHLHLRRLKEMEYLRVQHGGPGQAFVYQLRLEQTEVPKASRNHAGSRGVRGDRAGLRKTEESPARMQVPPTTARFCENTYRDNENEARAIDESAVSVMPQGKAVKGAK